MEHNDENESNHIILIKPIAKKNSIANEQFSIFRLTENIKKKKKNFINIIQSVLLHVVQPQTKQSF